MIVPHALNRSPLARYGALDTQALLALAIDKVEIHSNLHDPIVIDLRAPPDPRTQEILKRIQPAVILTGRAGRFEVAPAGMPTGIPDGARQALGLGGAVVIGGLLAMFLLR